MPELDFGTEYKVICKSDYCTFVVASGSKAECEKYISEYSNENIFPLILNNPYNNKEEKWPTAQNVMQQKINYCIPA